MTSLQPDAVASAPRPSSFGMGSKIMLAAVVVFAGFLMLIGLTPKPDLHGQNYTVYQAAALRGISLSHVQADTYIDQIAMALKVSPREAARIATSLAASGINPAAWTDAARAEAGYSAGVRSGVIKPN